MQSAVACGACEGGTELTGELEGAGDGQGASRCVSHSRGGRAGAVSAVGSRAGSVGAGRVPRAASNLQGRSEGERRIGPFVILGGRLGRL